MKSYMSRMLPAETRTTAQPFDLRSFLATGQELLPEHRRQKQKSARLNYTVQYSSVVAMYLTGISGRKG